MVQREGVRPDEFAEAWGISRSTVYSLLHRSDFPKIKIGRSTVIPVEASRRWMERQAGEGEAS